MTALTRFTCRLRLSITAADRCDRVAACFAPASIFRMKVRRIVIVVVHLDDDAIEPAEFRHRLATLDWGIDLPVACRLSAGTLRLHKVR